MVKDADSQHRDQAGNVSAGIIFDTCLQVRPAWAAHNPIAHGRPIAAPYGFPQAFFEGCAPAASAHIQDAICLRIIQKARQSGARSLSHKQSRVSGGIHPLWPGSLRRKSPSPSFADLLKGARRNHAFTAPLVRYSFGHIFSNDSKI